VHVYSRTVAWTKAARWLVVMALGVGLLALAWGWISRALQAGIHEVAFVEPRSARAYRVITRADHDAGQRSPVLFALHAYATPPDILVQSLSLVDLAVRERQMILVIPEGQRDTEGNFFWNASRACCGAGPGRPDDLAYLAGVLADVERHYRADPSQVSALGVSNGGFMAHRWACAGGPLRAIVSIAGAGAGAADEPCAPAVPLSVLQLHGDADAVIRYDGGSLRGSAYPSARDSLSAYLQAAQLEGPPRERERRFQMLWKVHEQEWANERARVALWTVRGGEHNLSVAPMAMPAILDFLLGR
jgi:polyhydroxybutyrate depolymerase